MKKLIISSVLGIMLAASTAFGQGFFTFSGSTRGAWDDTGTTPANTSTFDAAFLWAASTVTSAGVDAIMATTPTNNSTGGNPANLNAFSYATAWSDIMGDANFTIASSNGVTIVASPTSSNGSYTYQSGGAFGVAGTAANVTYSLFVIAWNTAGGTLLTPAQAAAANAPVGWSSVFSYTSTSAPPLGNPGLMSQNKFGIGYYPTPEPTTLALAGLGGISMLFLRRRKA